MQRSATKPQHAFTSVTNRTLRGPKRYRAPTGISNQKTQVPGSAQLCTTQDHSSFTPAHLTSVRSKPRPPTRRQAQQAPKADLRGVLLGPGTGLQRPYDQANNGLHSWYGNSSLSNQSGRH